MNKDKRVLPRRQSAFPITILDGKRPKIRGTLSDVTERGVGVRGIPASINEIRTFVIPANDFAEFAWVTFDALCRWARKGRGGEYEAGFEIRDISKADFHEFQYLIKAHTLSPSA